MNIKSFLYLLLLLTVFSSGYVPAQNEIKTSFEYSQHKILIYYQFAGESSSLYDVSVVLKRTSDPNFKLEPASLSGDYGEGKFANVRREIIWNLSQQKESSLTENDYYFEIAANQIKQGGGIAWYVYVGGILVGGGVAAALLLNKKSETTTSNSGFTFPSPPGRPY